MHHAHTRATLSNSERKYFSIYISILTQTLNLNENSTQGQTLLNVEGLTRVGGRHLQP